MATTKTVAERPRGGSALGASPTAGTFLVLAGLMQGVQGLVALVNDEYLAVLRTEYLFEFDTTTWGWVHLVLGALLVAAGIGFFRGMVWARVTALVLAALSILVSFAWLPFSLVWSITVIVVDLLVIWAATAHGRGVLEA